MLRLTHLLLLLPGLVQAAPCTDADFTKVQAKQISNTGIESKKRLDAGYFVTDEIGETTLSFSLSDSALPKFPAKGVRQESWYGLGAEYAYGQVQNLQLIEKNGEKFLRINTEESCGVDIALPGNDSSLTQIEGHVKERFAAQIKAQNKKDSVKISLDSVPAFHLVTLKVRRNQLLNRISHYPWSAAAPANDGQLLAPASTDGSAE